MKKSFVGPLITAIVALLVVAMFVYFYVSLNRLDKKMGDLQQSVVDDSSKLTTIVNFLNSAASTQKK